MNQEKNFPVPVIGSPYRRIFLPGAATYFGRPHPDLNYGETYSEWVPNDHCFIFDRKGFCHIFGITHPLTSCQHIHDGEEQLFHAMAPREVLLSEGEFTDCGNLLPPEERPGEPPEIHSPFILEKDGEFQMVYGPKSFRSAASKDLQSWELRGEWFHDPHGASRDPQICRVGDEWFLTYCSGSEVRCRVSRDCAVWSDFRVLRRLPDDLNPESPFLFVRDGVFYLAVCLWDGKWDRIHISDAYQHRTLLYAAESPDELNTAPQLCELPAHAPEFVQCDGRWFVSSAEYPERGINLAELDWR